MACAGQEPSQPGCDEQRCGWCLEIPARSAIPLNQPGLQGFLLQLGGLRALWYLLFDYVPADYWDRQLQQVINRQHW